MFSCPGYLCVSSKDCVENAGIVRFFYSSEDGIPSGTGKIVGDRALLAAAWKVRRATLLALDENLRVQITGFDMDEGALTVRAAPLFKTLAARIKVVP
jgi:hypothetical protein